MPQIKPKWKLGNLAQIFSPPFFFRHDDRPSTQSSANEETKPIRSRPDEESEIKSSVSASLPLPLSFSLSSSTCVENVNCEEENSGRRMQL